MSKAKQSKPVKRCYHFSQKRTDGSAKLRDLLGGKGANLAEMSKIGLPVPPGFTITAETCHDYMKAGNRLPDGLMRTVRRHIALLEQQTGKEFGGSEWPLLLSVRSGAAISMPGMMDTVLNLGLNDESVRSLGKLANNERFAYDLFRRLINMFGNVVRGVDHEHFEKAFDSVKKKYKAKLDTDVPAEGMKDLCKRYKRVYKKHVGEDFPLDPYVQLESAIEAVFSSWNKPSAVSYRKIHGITHLRGTGANVQTMVYGNMGKDSGTGVAFTRDPSTGENALYGEFLINAQGEDVVAGIRTPKQISHMAKWDASIRRQLETIRRKLEKHYRDMQDIEFTIERGKLWMLQTRTGKRTGTSAVKIAVDMAKSKLIDKQTAVQRVTPDDLMQLLLPSFMPKDKKAAKYLTKGLPASPGAASGKLAFTAEEAVARSKKGEKVLLIRNETSPEDIDGMHHASGILTSTGGMTSHAAVVARGWGKCCIVGAGEIRLNTAKRSAVVNGVALGPNDVVSIDGSTGQVYKGPIKLTPPAGVSGDFGTLMKWADSFARMGVRTNADTPADSKRARDFGAVGIGLTRTEHMFFGGKRITAMQEMIVASTEKERKKALKKLLPFQRRDFIGIFTAMKGLPVTVRLLDPPLHEFLPQDTGAQKELAKGLGIPARQLADRVTALHESNPMLGHRGCRLAITYPEIVEMQVTAITEAMIACKRKKIDARPEIMIPLVGVAEELRILRALTEKTIAAVKEKSGYKPALDIPIGTMIEIPRACLTAKEVAKHADFFSFGTNDLTQMAYGYSRDDIAGFLPEYRERGVLEQDPFECLDAGGVGQLVKMGVKGGRSRKRSLKVGVCGEHGGEPSSVRFFHGAGLNYVSCSPFRVPIARLVAAQATIE